jgi:hypothetical protein
MKGKNIFITLTLSLILMPGFPLVNQHSRLSTTFNVVRNHIANPGPRMAAVTQIEARSVLAQKYQQTLQQIPRQR